MTILKRKHRATLPCSMFPGGEKILLLMLLYRQFHNIHFSEKTNQMIFLCLSQWSINRESSAQVFGWNGGKS